MKVLLFPILLGFSLTYSLSAQCASVTTYDGVIRYNGNLIQGTIGSELSGPCKNDWEPGIEGTFDRNGSLIFQRASPYYGPAGGSVTWDFPSIYLSDYGPGLYSAWGYHTAHCISVNCGGTSVYAPPYTDSWDGWDVGSGNAERPEISGVNGAWWLGGLADSVNGLYNQALLTVDKKCSEDLCPEDVYWTITQGSSRISLSCSSACGSTNILTTAATSSTVDDVKFKVGMSGWESDIFSFTVAQPVIVSNGSPTDRKASESPFYGLGDQGFWSTIPYAIYPSYLVSSGVPLPGASPMTVGVNECFTGGTMCQGPNPWPADQATNWGRPTPGGGNFSTFVDNMSFACPIASCNTTNYQPVPLEPGTGASTAVHHATQVWSVGSASVGSGSAGVGLGVLTVTHQRYTDRGRHQ